MNSLLLIKLFTVRLGLGVVMPIVAVCPPSGGEELICIEKERKKENRHAKRGMGRGQGPHLHEQDFGRTIRGTGGALLLLTRDTTGSQRGARWNPNSTGGLISV